MQTFITHTGTSEISVCKRTALSLDNKRLGKQRVECKQILTAIETGQGWIHHPATKMWEGHVEALAVYAHVICTEWQKRGHADTLLDYFDTKYAADVRSVYPESVEWPWWFGHPMMVASHRSKLLRKDGPHYEPMWAIGEEHGLWADFRLPYLWPDPDFKHHFMLSRAEYQRKDWEIPKSWNLTGVGRLAFR